MFASFKFTDVEGNFYYELINVAHISRVRYKNPMNIDAGSILVFKNGLEVHSPEPKDIIDVLVLDTMVAVTLLVALVFSTIFLELR